MLQSKLLNVAKTKHAQPGFHQHKQKYHFKKKERQRNATFPFGDELYNFLSFPNLFLERNTASYYPEINSFVRSHRI